MGALPQMCETLREDISAGSGRGRVGGQQRMGRMRRGGGGIEQRRQQHDSNTRRTSNTSNTSNNSRDAKKNPTNRPGNADSAPVPSVDSSSAKLSLDSGSKVVASASSNEVASASSKGVARDLWREQFDCPGHVLLPFVEKDGDVDHHQNYDDDDYFPQQNVTIILIIVCMDEMRPPSRIFQCSQGHVLCGSCR